MGLWIPIGIYRLNLSYNIWDYEFQSGFIIILHPIPDPSGSDDASDPELLEEEEEEVMDAPAQHPPHPMTLCGGMTEFDEDYLNGWEVIWQDDPGFEHGLPPFFGNRGTNVVGVELLHYHGVCLSVMASRDQWTWVPNSLLMGVNSVDYEPQGTEVIQSTFYLATPG